MDGPIDAVNNDPELDFKELAAGAQDRTQIHVLTITHETNQLRHQSAHQLNQGKWSTISR